MEREKSLREKFMGTERTTFIIDENGKIAHIFRKSKLMVIPKRF
jgi:peroxiredoxin